jgi:hypothetical protein
MLSRNAVSVSYNKASVYSQEHDIGQCAPLPRQRRRDAVAIKVPTTIDLLVATLTLSRPDIV